MELNNIEKFRQKFKEFAEDCEYELGIKPILGTIRYSDEYNFSTRLEVIPAGKSQEEILFDKEVQKGLLKVKKELKPGLTPVVIQGNNYIFLGAKKGKYHSYPVLLRGDSAVVWFKTWNVLSEYVESVL